MTDFGRRPGQMLKSVYDTNNDGVVDNSAKLEASTKAQVQDHTPQAHGHAMSLITGLLTALAGKSATGHTHTESEITDLSHDAQKIKGVVVDDAAKADTYVLAYDSASTTLKYAAAAGDGAHHALHEDGGADEVDVTGLVGTTPRAILADATPGRVFRSVYLVIQDGSQDYTLKCTSNSLFNGDVIAVTDNIAKDATTGHYLLESSGGTLHILNTGLSGNVLHVMGALYRNDSTADLTADFQTSGTAIQINLRNSTTGAAIDITTLADDGLMILGIAYITDA